jgi:predicted nucleic acid-binding protein
MHAYWDTSALLALVVQEAHSADALKVEPLVTLNYAWEWMRVEAEAGLHRRQASESRFHALARHLRDIRWLTIARADHAAIGELNRRHRLRAADAGHLYCLMRATQTIPDIQLISFDQELTTAARAEGLRVWAP